MENQTVTPKLKLARSDRQFNNKNLKPNTRISLNCYRNKRYDFRRQRPSRFLPTEEQTKKIIRAIYNHKEGGVIGCLAKFGSEREP